MQIIDIFKNCPEQQQEQQQQQSNPKDLGSKFPRSIKNLAILCQYYLQHIAGTFKSTKPEKGGPGPITSPSIGTQGHAWVSDG